MKKKGIQLSMNFLVTIIIALVILASGILLVNKFFENSKKIAEDLDQRTKDELNRLLDQGQQIVIPFSTQTIKKGRSHIFGVGVLNINPQNQFKIEIEFSRAEDQNKNRIPNVIIDDWFTYDNSLFSLDKNQRDTKKVLVTVPNEAQKGTYIFNVLVSNNDGAYDNLKKIIIMVR